MQHRAFLGILTAGALLVSLAGCGAEPSGSAGAAPTSAEPAEVSASAADAGQTQPTEEPAQPITLDGDTITAPGAQVEGSTVTITQGGSYTLQGNLDDGQILVDAGDEDVTLILAGAEIACADSAPIYVLSAGETTLYLAEGTENTVTDGAQYALPEGADEPDAAIFAKDDLTIDGPGSLTVHGQYDMAIHGKDSLTIRAKVTVDAVGDGIKGKDAVYLADCDLNVTAGEDGIQSNNDSADGDIFIQSGTVTVQAQGDGIKAERSIEITGGDISVTAGADGLKAKNTIGGGTILIQDGAVTVDAQQDAIQSEGDLTVEGGSLKLVTLGGSANAPEHTGDFFGGPPGWFNDTTTEDETASAKGLKAAGTMTITGGDIQIDAYDDAVHSDGDIEISGTGTLTLSSGDDGIHADNHLTVAAGTIQIDRCYEGLEALMIDISGGDITLTATDDGMNANGEEMFGPGFGAQTEDTLETAKTYLHITGGNIVVDASGDGLDSNGLLLVEGGTVYVSGPSEAMNGALDTGTSAQITGGTVLAYGAAGMDETFSDASTQPSIRCVFRSSLPGDSTITLSDSQGSVLVEFQLDAPDKWFSSVVVSCPELTLGQRYTLQCGTETVEIDLSDMVTSVQQTAQGSTETAASGGFGGFGGPPPGGPPVTAQ